jgi:CDP-diacylglycerol--glycerol-3-phosphate 3-phosphatidyltransferase
MSKGSFVSPDQRSGIRARIEPIALAMSRAGLTPNMLTLIGFGIAAAGGLLLAVEWWALGGVVATAGAGFDMFDGAVARATGQVSKLGAFMDSTFDRWGEGVVYIGIIIGTTQADFDLGTWLAGAALVSAFMVSYTRAKSESMGFSSGTGMAAIGFAPREVRTVILAIALVGAGLTGGVTTSLSDLGTLILAAGLALIALLATITVIQRVLFVTRQNQSDEQDQSSEPNQSSEGAEAER